ncbi:PREDICTED: progressive rod-cone degeneration protein [Charadrius vociferus]|uniref:progressive rod-cone degeneration protein n=1 Tax=Charadrius vociferus TaxID=50402 RepID=UPI000521AE7A|nr:PREDICTED: progressive rod-cone degeneration protein [Charadrius vociferus]
MCTTILLLGTLVMMLRRRFFNKVEPSEESRAGAGEGVRAAGLVYDSATVSLLLGASKTLREEPGQTSYLTAIVTTIITTIIIKVWPVLPIAVFKVTFMGCAEAWPELV